MNSFEAWLEKQLDSPTDAGEFARRWLGLWPPGEDIRRIKVRLANERAGFYDFIALEFIHLEYLASGAG